MIKLNNNIITILHLRSSGGMLGAENVIIEIIKESRNFGYEGIIGIIKNTSDPVPDLLLVAESQGIQTKVFECRWSFDINTVREIRIFLKKHTIKILHCHGYKENFYGFFANSKIPKIATNHLWKGSNFKAKSYCLIDSLIIRSFDGIVGVSDEIVDNMRKIGITKSFKISNGIDCKKFDIRPKTNTLLEKFNIKSTDFVLGMISSLTYEKNHQAALEAIYKIHNPKLKLIIVGSGKLDNQIRRQVDKLGLSHQVIFTGSLLYINDVLSVIDVFLLPSLKEGLPMALLEAMASGKAVIASDVGDIKKVIIHNINGLLIKNNDIGNLVESINFFIMNQNKIYEYGYAARRTVHSMFSSKIMAENYCILYGSLI